MPKRKSGAVSRNQKSPPKSFAADQLVDRLPDHPDPPAPSFARPRQGADLCRCQRGPRAPGKLFCADCGASYSKLWTTSGGSNGFA